MLDNVHVDAHVDNVNSFTLVSILQSLVILLDRINQLFHILNCIHKSVLCLLVGIHFQIHFQIAFPHERMPPRHLQVDERMHPRATAAKSNIAMEWGTMLNSQIPGLKRLINAEQYKLHSTKKYINRPVELQAHVHKHLKC